MPNYTAGSAKVLYPGESITLFNAESPAPPQLSQAIFMGSSVVGGTPLLAVEVTFGGAPGAFNVQEQEAVTDAANNYLTPSNAASTITAVSANNIANTAVTPGKPFVAFLLSSRTNSVSVTVKVTRLV